MKISVYSPLRISFAGGGTDISPFFENMVEQCLTQQLIVEYY